VKEIERISNMKYRIVLLLEKLTTKTKTTNCHPDKDIILQIT
jgi:hypothetical protein